MRKTYSAPQIEEMTFGVVENINAGDSLFNDGTLEWPTT